MVHFLLDGVSIGQMIGYATGFLFIAAALRRRSKLLRVTLPIRAKNSPKEE
jgi:hypothetical protein